MKLQTKQATILADTLTPVSIYLKLRDIYPNSILLESNLNEKREKSHSYICLSPIAQFLVGSDGIQQFQQDELVFSEDSTADVGTRFSEFLSQFQISGESSIQAVYGHTNYNAVSFFESIELDKKPLEDDLPKMNYAFFRYVISIDHFTNELTFTEFIPEGESSELNQLTTHVQSLRFTSYPFETNGSEESFTSPETFLNQVEKGKEHCQLGDVFQMVISRRFTQSFTGDDFQVYRSLRSINPSPYLFYFDMGSYKIFGSSPEAQIRIDNKTAVINPIAGTYKRTGDLQKDQALAEELKNDDKENAEHVMLVDLARNDLGRVGRNVELTAFKEIHFYSHVIHMVSEVEAELQDDFNPISIFGHTFPAGTLSGAPKYRAMQLIDEYEPVSRNFYGGGIGFVELNGNLNHAIMIRSFLSHNNTLHYQAGAGIVVNSNAQSELQEVDNKIGALRKAIANAQNIQGL